MTILARLKAGRAAAQEFQKVAGTLKSGGKNQAISNGRLHGDEISFSAGVAEYRGRVAGAAMEGTVRSGANASAWSARR